MLLTRLSVEESSYLRQPVEEEVRQDRGDQFGIAVEVEGGREVEKEPNTHGCD